MEYLLHQDLLFITKGHEKIQSIEHLSFSENIIASDWFGVVTFSEYLNAFCSNILSTEKVYETNGIRYLVCRKDNINYLNIVYSDDEMYLEKVDAKILYATISKLLQKCKIEENSFLSYAGYIHG
jgi:hypothetical protein